MVQRRASAVVVMFVGILIGVCLRRWDGPRAVAAGPAAVEPKGAADDVAALRADVARLKAVVPDQSHAMVDVGYHFTNLWFAAKAGNWPLAQFYSDELRSHLKWAVRVIPMRKDRDGRDVDLTAILAALEQGSLKDLSDSVRARDAQQFTKAYTVQMENCMACHRAAGKEFLVLHVPERPDAGIIEFGVAKDAGK